MEQIIIKLRKLAGISTMGFTLPKRIIQHLGYQPQQYFSITVNEKTREITLTPIKAG